MGFDSLAFLLLSTLWFYSLVGLFSPPALHAALVQIGLKVVFLRDFPLIAENQEKLVPSPKLKFQNQGTSPLYPFLSMFSQVLLALQRQLPALVSSLRAVSGSGTASEFPEALGTSTLVAFVPGSVARPHSTDATL